MLRIILRNTHNALLFACTLLLLCSLERLWRYDFARGTETDEHAAVAAAADLQVDHFVPAWEATMEDAKNNNPVSSGLFKFMTFASSRTAAAATTTATTTTTTQVAPVLTTATTPPAEETENGMLAATPKTLEESKIILRRQIRQRKRSHPTTTSRDKNSNEPVQVQPQGLGHVPDNDNDNAAKRKPLPKIGFVLHLPSCDRGAVAKWQSVWHEQSIDQAFLFHVLLGSTVDPSCLLEIQADLRNNNNNNNDDNDDIIYQVSQNEHLALTLQTCQSPQTNVLQSLQLEQLLYYDATKAKGRLRSSAVLRRFSDPMVPSVFACIGGGQQKPAFCDESVLECPWFQYSPVVGVVTPTEEGDNGQVLLTQPQKVEVAVA